jgi:hypothetical protein
MKLSLDNIKDYADTLVLQVRGGGRELDYSEASIQTLEELLQVSDDLMRGENFPDAQRNLIVFYNGCYLGQVLSDNLIGVWRFDENWYDSTIVFRTRAAASRSTLPQAVSARHRTAGRQ